MGGLIVIMWFIVLFPSYLYHLAGAGHVGQLFALSDACLMHLVIIVDDLNQVVFVPALAHDAQTIGNDERRCRGDRVGHHRGPLVSVGLNSCDARMAWVP